MTRRGPISKIGSAAAGLSLLTALIGCGAKGPTHPYSIASQKQQQARSQSGTATAANLIVKLRPSASSDNVAKAVGARTVSFFPQLGMVVLGLPEGTSHTRAMASLAGNPGVMFAEPDFRMKSAPIAPARRTAARTLQMTPSDPGLKQQWGHDAIRVRDAWDRTLGDPRVVVAVVDTGVDLTHPDLKGRIVPSGSRTFVPGTASPMDDNGHGTHVAGVVAAEINNSIGIAGVAPRCRILPVKVLDAEGQGNTSDIVAGLLYAADAGAKVINLSLGGGSGSKALEEAIRYAHGKGSLIVAAMGNDGKNLQEYPAAYSGVLSVGATSRGGDDFQVAEFSNFGGWISVAAPGDGIWSTMPTYPTTLSESEGAGEGYGFLSGTSMATPYVAGVAALVASLYPSLPPAAIKARIERSAVDVGPRGFDWSFGNGQIDALRALTGN
ncbi:MAG: S8 family serine peptidase [Candidatus Sericytochromatia bacterium]|nr:S8 family serine peptidase [Candidatus Tanganyikabacteria bacterium]